MAGYVFFSAMFFFYLKYTCKPLKKNQLLNIIWFNPMDALNLTDIKKFQKDLTFVPQILIRTPCCFGLIRR